MANYSWKPGARLSGDAQRVGEELHRIEQCGPLTPRAVVDASRRKSAPLHGYFEWNDGIAAEKYREVQAGGIIRSVQVVTAAIEEPTRAFVSVALSDGAESEEPTRRYVNIETALAEPDSRDSLLAQALYDLNAFKRKYSTLVELAGVFAAIEAVA